jgi:hypothetical protein
VNAQRRTKINKALYSLNLANQILAEVREDEQEAFDALSETTQEGPKGQAIQTSLEALDVAVDLIEQAEEAAESATAES